MASAFFVMAIGLACWFVLRRQTAIIVELRAELEVATADADALRVNGQKELERLEERVDKLDRENESLSVENRMRKEYAHVCSECKRHDPAVREQMERNLRSVTRR